MDPRHQLMQIGEFAKLAGTNLRTLRYYEELALLQPADRSEGGFRLYRRSQLDRLEAIKRLQSLGLSLKEIADALGPAQPCASVLGQLRPALERQIALTSDKIERLQAELGQLTTARQRLIDVCQHCDEHPSLERCDPCPHDQVPLPPVLRALLS